MMPHASIRRQFQEHLDRIERHLANDDGDGKLRFARAVLLNWLGRDEEAKSAYLELLRVMPSHFDALNNLGALLRSQGDEAAARKIFQVAVELHPDNPVGHINLAFALMSNGELEPARHHFELALRLAPDHPEAHQGIAHVLNDLGEEERACPHREKGFRTRPVKIMPYRGAGTPIPLLVLTSAAGGAVPIRSHIDDRIFSTTVLFVEFHDPTAPLPPHQLIFNAVGDADRCAPAIETAITLLSGTTAPVINRPAAVRATGRVVNARRLGGIADVVAPKMAIVPRAALAGGDAEAVLADCGIAFPCLLRSPGHHLGRHFVRVENEEALAAALLQLPGAELIAIEFFDARGADGKIRKYRVMIIDGRLYPVHAAVSYDWKVHYFSADMAENADHRAEDERFLNAMPEVLGPRLMAALTRIGEMLGLDYMGVDFGISRTGELLLFEANATMVVYPPDSGVRWDYRRGPIQRVFDAIGLLLLSRAQQTAGVLATGKNPRLAGSGDGSRIVTAPKDHLESARLAFRNADFAGCAASCETLLRERPSDVAVLHLLGVARLRLGESESAMNALDAALALAPADLALRIDRAQAAAETGRIDAAIRVLSDGGRFHPGNPQLAACLARLLSDCGAHPEAQRVLEAGIRAAPADLDLRLQMAGECLADLRFDEALAQLRVADDLVPGRPATYSDIGFVHQSRGDLDEAMGCYRRALSLDPEDSQAHVNLATTLLTRGEYQQGFAELEWRLRLSGYRRSSPALPRWMGESLDGRRLLVTAEQGYGDVIQYARFLPQLPAYGGEVVVECPPLLDRLFAGMAGVSRTISLGEVPPGMDFSVPLLSLPFVLGGGPPPSPPYLPVGPAEGLVLPPDSRFKVGLAWTAGPAGGDVYVRRLMDRRSCPVDMLLPLLAVDGVAFYSLQVDRPERRRAPPQPLVDLAPWLSDFADTAAVIGQLDLIISVDTAVAHLAGAMDKPLWVMLGPGQSDYRWGRQADHSPWYPHAHLFRCGTDGWSPLVRRVAEQLRRQACRS